MKCQNCNNYKNYLDYDDKEIKKALLHEEIIDIELIEEFKEINYVEIRIDTVQNKYNWTVDKKVYNEMKKYLNQFWIETKYDVFIDRGNRRRLNRELRLIHDGKSCAIGLTTNLGVI